ncbi:MAG: di-trans,poly-cis-decaprenylcistransferase [Bacteroidales bacterium]|nr:di-trans,poly-cis-decaprenylcistransferase [Bacteroidales bacterium]
MESTEKKVPQHVSIIMDGNGRWARERGKERVYGHLNGVESVRAVTEESVAQGIRYLSLYAFSEENWNRPQEEVGYLMQLMMKSIAGEFENLMKNGVRFVVLGNRSRLSDTLNEAIDTLMEQTKDNPNLTLIVFLSYSGKWDILQGARKLAEAAVKDPHILDNLQISDFDNYLVTAGIPDPDLIIRTSGEQRISNYLLWQGAYSEFYFTDILWPDFRKEAYRQALAEYARRDRRYGKVK